MPLPKALRQITPDVVRDNPRLRALALGAGFIPPRVMHAPEEADALRELASGRRVVVEIGVYEGSSALVLISAMPPGSELHLIDPFVDESGWALPSGWGATEQATRKVVARASRSGGPTVHWHVERSQDVGRRWSGEVDFVFIDGDHSPDGVRDDWDAWSPHVKPGGVVAFHDARGTSEGPQQVVNELFYGDQPTPGWKVTHEVGTLVAVTRN
jgi:predicted O-methyltransferase YrrM